MQVLLEIPDELMPHLVAAGQDAARVLLEDAVAEAYREGRLTLHLVGRLLGLRNDIEIDRFLGKREIFDFTVEDFDRDWETMQRVIAKRTVELCP